MVPLTRRRLLHGTVGLLVVSAGCNDSISDTTTETASEPPNGDTETVPDHHALRHSETEPTVRVPNERRRDTTTATSSADEPPKNAVGRGFVTSTEDAQQLWFADVDGAAEARQFVADTDFENETIYVEFRSVRECRYLELCSVRWSATDIHTQYGSYYRAPDVPCRADAEDGVSWLIRIPEVLNPDAITGHGSGWSSSGCRRRPPSLDDETTTDAPDFGPKSPTNGTEKTTTAEENR